MATRNIFVTGANGYVGLAVCRAFVASGWAVWGLVRSERSVSCLQGEEVRPIVGSIDDVASHAHMVSALPTSLDAIVSATEDMARYEAHFSAIMALFRTVAAGRGRPLVFFTSGNKDYGVPGHVVGKEGLRPSVEGDSPINAPRFVTARLGTAPGVFAHADAFPAVLVRPTNLHGRGGTYSRTYFEAGAHAAARRDKTLRVAADPRAIVHSLHVDDCARAYVAMAEYHLSAGSDAGSGLGGHIINVAAAAYETVDDIARAIAAEFGLAGGVEYVGSRKDLEPGTAEIALSHMLSLAGWTSAEKLRSLTGWTDVLPALTKEFGLYRRAMEAEVIARRSNTVIARSRLC